MALLAFDIGGTAVKFGLFKHMKLEHRSSFATPATWEEMKDSLLAIKQGFESEGLQGVAISSPGAVDSERGMVGGLSAVPYIHHFEIRRELEELFGLPVTIENDANCAALAEVGLGVAKNRSDALFFIIGSGLGGAVVLDRKLRKGPNLFAGEFGFMRLTETNTLSELVSPVHVANRFRLEYQIEGSFSGKDLFDLADQGHEAAIRTVCELYDHLARGIFNIMLVLNPELVAIGGGLSVRQGLMEELDKRVEQLKIETGSTDLQCQLAICHFNKDANLIGACVHFMEQHPSILVETS